MEKKKNIIELSNEPDDNNERDLLISDGEEEEDMSDNFNLLIYYDLFMWEILWYERRILILTCH